MKMEKAICEYGGEFGFMGIKFVVTSTTGNFRLVREPESPDP